MDYLGYILAIAILLLTRFYFPGYVGYAILCLFMMAAAPIGYLLIRRRMLGDYLIRVGDWMGWLKVSVALLIIAVPIMYFGSTLVQFQSYYPTWPPAAESLENLLLYEGYMLALMVATEVYYRGFLMNQLLKDTRYGNELHSFIYMLAHIGKPPLEVIYSLPVGWLFGRIDQRYKSILPSLLMHFISSLIFDLMVLNQRGLPPL
jgi:membrane protease YdiL (CAAX protease family)